MVSRTNNASADMRAGVRRGGPKMRDKLSSSPGLEGASFNLKEVEALESAAVELLASMLCSPRCCAKGVVCV